MELHVSLAGRGELTSRIYRQLLDAVLDGRLPPGERLPATRELAARLGVSRNTVAAAYDRLTAEGFLTGRVGAGTFVCAQPVRQDRPQGAPADGGARPRGFWATIPSEPVLPTPLFDFRVGLPDPRLFPLAAWRRLVAGELRSAVLSAGAADPAGHPGLRAAIARYAGIARSVRVGADQVVVTQGAQQALDLVGRVLVEPGDQVAVEEPGYPLVRHLLGSLGARVVGVPVDDDGLVVDALPDAARLVYVTPSHQFPLGIPMSLARRSALLAWAAAHDAVVVEDDYDTEYRFAGRPFEPLQSLDRDGRVVYVGSFSKTLLPALRVGFLVAPPSLLRALHAARRLADRHGDPTTQGALARFIDEGLLARHVRRTTREYATRRAELLSGLRALFPGLLRPVEAAAGLHICVRLAPGVTLDVDALADRARAAGVAFDSLAAYCAEEPAQPGLVLGYGQVRAGEIGEGLRRLAAAFPPPVGNARSATFSGRLT